MDYQDMAAYDLYCVRQRGGTLQSYIDWLQDVINNPSSMQKLEAKTNETYGSPEAKQYADTLIEIIKRNPEGLPSPVGD